MQWEYAHALYESGRLTPNVDDGMAEIDHEDMRSFLKEAGQEGWELCGVLPFPGKESVAKQALTVIFKRPLAPAGH